uniref:Uncharacterized protein LOC110208483 n=1 Tax=Phascolarctos cinereus TaxID=38626 RepID=A0A6P5KB17_PHACI|nr:uncharacterized protein LOC110208483 [Phascolarctos cinereus]
MRSKLNKYITNIFEFDPFSWSQSHHSSEDGNKPDEWLTADYEELLEGTVDRKQESSRTFQHVHLTQSSSFLPPWDLRILIGEHSPYLAQSPHCLLAIFIPTSPCTSWLLNLALRIVIKSILPYLERTCQSIMIPITIVQNTPPWLPLPTSSQAKTIRRGPEVETLVKVTVIFVAQTPVLQTNQPRAPSGIVAMLQGYSSVVLGLRTGCQILCVIWWVLSGLTRLLQTKELGTLPMNQAPLGDDPKLLVAF